MVFQGGREACSDSSEANRWEAPVSQQFSEIRIRVSIRF